MTRFSALRFFAFVAFFFLVSRLALTGVGLAAPSWLGSGQSLHKGNVQRDWAGPGPLEVWARWDSEWYLLIAERGYRLDAEMAGRKVRYLPADATGFFPLYPIATRAVADLLAFVPGLDRLVRATSPPGAAEETSGRRGLLLLAALLIANAAAFGSLLLLAERAFEVGGPSRGLTAADPARRAAFAAAALLAWPPALFLSAAYAESLLLLLGLLCFRALRKGQWWTAGIAGALASATKPSGLLLIVPAFFVLFAAPLAAAEKGRPAPLSRWLTLLLYPAGAAAFSMECARLFGDPLTWFHRQERWRGALSWPWTAFTRWAEAPALHGAHGSTIELVLAVTALLLLGAAIFRRPAAETIFAASVVLPPLGSTLWSFGRLSLQAFPLFLVLGDWAARRPWLSAIYFVPAVAGSAALMAWYGAWWWAG